MEEVKIHSGTRVKLKQVDETSLPREFIDRLTRFADDDERVQAVWFLAIQAETEAEQPSLVLAVKVGSLLSKKEDVFLQVVDRLQTMLPDDLSVNIYRFGASDLLARYCLESLKPLYLRDPAWLEKQRKRFIT